MALSVVDQLIAPCLICGNTQSNAVNIFTIVELPSPRGYNLVVQRRSCGIVDDKAVVTIVGRRAIAYSTFWTERRRCDK